MESEALNSHMEAQKQESSLSEVQKDPIASTTTQKITMAAFVISMIGAVISVDLFAFENGAIATISQVWLTVNKKIWVLTYVLAILCGILLQHVSVARDPGVIPDTPFWKQMLYWTPAFWLGIYIGYKWLYQLPNVD